MIDIFLTLLNIIELVVVEGMKINYQVLDQDWVI